MPIAMPLPELGRIGAIASYGSSLGSSRTDGASGPVQSLRTA
jgi:hypothetical protein